MFQVIVGQNVYFQVKQWNLKGLPYHVAECHNYSFIEGLFVWASLKL